MNNNIRVPVLKHHFLFSEEQKLNSLHSYQCLRQE